MNYIGKSEFKKKYGYSESTYQRRLAKLKNTQYFCKAYKRPTSQEVRIDTDLYDLFLDFESYNRLLTRKIKPIDFLKLEKVGEIA